jgi:hypothetical protein
VKLGVGELRVMRLIYKGDGVLKVISTNSLVCHIKEEPDWLLNYVAVIT